jgi:subtilisin family serine protease
MGSWTRISKLSWGALVGAFFASSQALAKPVRYVIKVKNGGYADAALRREIGASNRKALMSELTALSASRERKPVSFSRAGIVVFEGEEADVEQALQGHPLVEYFERDVEWRPAATSASTPTPSSQERAPWLADILGLDEESPASDVEPDSGDKVLVAVVDTGVNVSHPFLQPALAQNATELNGVAGVDDDGNGIVDDSFGANVMSSSGDVSESTTDHGTHVAGLVKVVRDQAIPRWPAAKRVQILPVRFIDANGVGSTASAVAALEYAASRGARVINASWGARGTDAFSRALYDTMVELYKRDVVLAVAAGNAERGGPNNNDVTPYFPANFAIPSLLSVASITPSYVLSGGRRVLEDSPLSDFSNYGSGTVDLAAPGSFSDVWGDASGVYSANARFVSSRNEYIRKRGTSMATPVVAGAAAVVRAINPKLTAYEVKKLLSDTVTSKGGLLVKSGGVLDAAAAFSAAERAVSTGNRGQLSSAPFTNASEADLRDAGGCGSIAGPGEGPGGGNSLGWLSVAYLLLALARQILRKNSRSDSAISAKCSTRS